VGRQTQLHVLAKDVNELLIAMHGKEPLEVAFRRGNAVTPERLPFVPENIDGQVLVMWSERFAPNLQARYVPAQPPYYCIDEQTESVFELSLSRLTTWQGRPALTQGRIYAVFQNKQPEFEKCYDQLIRYIRRHWRKNPTDPIKVGGYLGPAASEWFDRGGLLLPGYIPPVRSDWIERLSKQHSN
jgi:hypothetical protein